MCYNINTCRIHLCLISSSLWPVAKYTAIALRDQQYLHVLIADHPDSAIGPVSVYVFEYKSLLNCLVHEPHNEMLHEVAATSSDDFLGNVIYLNASRTFKGI